MNNFSDYRIGVPSGKTGNIKTLCPECSMHRKNKTDPCLSVNIEEGVWNCHNCGWAGTLKQNTRYDRPEYKLFPLEPAKEWFKNRGISFLTAQQLRIGFKNDSILFPYYRGEQVINIKSKPIGGGRYYQSANAEPIFYNLNALKNTKTGIIVEGEMDVLACCEAGITNVISVPNGAPNEADSSADAKLKCLNVCAKDIKHITSWVIAVDNDPNGRRLEYELVRRLGAENCKVIDWHDYLDCKDANDVLMKYTQKDLQFLISSAKDCAVEGVHEFSEYEEQLELIRVGTPLYETVECGINNLDSKYKVGAGYVTVITGVPSSGKSTLAACITTELARKHGWRFGVFCPENPSAKMGVKIIQAYGQKNIEEMSQDKYEESKQFLFKHFFELLSPKDKASPSVEKLLELASLQVKRYGIRGLVIDAYSRLSKELTKTKNETQFISEMLDKISRWAKKEECHVWIVAHPYKIKKARNGDYEVVRPYDISGSASWFNSCDMILSLHRQFDIDRDNVVDVHVMKVKEEPEFGELGSVELKFNRRNGYYF